MGKILSNYIEDTKQEFRNLGLFYCPGSIYHGSSKRMGAASYAEIQDKAELGRLNDFIEYLFEHSEHCNHISQSEAWDEFEQWEFKKEIVVSVDNS